MCTGTYKPEEEEGAMELDMVIRWLAGCLAGGVCTWMGCVGDSWGGMGTGRGAPEAFIRPAARDV